jgi:hypothetical protein
VDDPELEHGESDLLVDNRRTNLTCLAVKPLEEIGSPAIVGIHAIMCARLTTTLLEYLPVCHIPLGE